MCELENLIKTYPNGIVYDELDDSEMNVIDCTYLLPRDMKTLYLGELSQFPPQALDSASTSSGSRRQSKFRQVY
jgi:hypothetical protein